MVEKNNNDGKFAMIPREATELWMIRILSSLALSLLELFDVKDILVDVLYGNLFAPVSISIVLSRKWQI